jgi:hypothetical protein
MSEPVRPKRRWAQAPRPAGSYALPNCGTACRNLGIRVTKQQPLARNFFAVLPTSRHAQHPSISYRGRRVTDEAFRSQEGEPTAGCPAKRVSRLLRLWLSEASLRALAGAWGRFLRET